MSAIVSRYQQWIEKEIRKQKYGKEPESLYEPIRYLMGIGGKRLRPVLTLLGYSIFKDDVKSIVPYAIAVEAFHNFTLMHDDIMDKAPLRRGHATVHEKWNVNTAILSGDVMLINVYDMLLSVESGKLKRILKAFNTCAAEVCEGQQWDMEFEKEKTVTESQYLNMVRLKTAVLLGFSLELGAILADAPESECVTLRKFGTSMGIGFQLKDDFLDAYADPEKFGKQIGGDIIANKKTFLLIKALDIAKGRQKNTLNEWLSIKKFKKREKVEAIRAIFDALNIPALTEKKVSQYFRKSFENLNALSCPEDRKINLREFAEGLIARQS